MGQCKNCRWCQTLQEQGFIFTSTGYFCTNPPVVQAKGQGKFSHDVRVSADGSCKLFERRPTLNDIGFRG